MIVNNIEAGWEVIYHYAHGLLAGQIAHHLQPELRADRWVETLTAIIEHDDQQLDFSEKVYTSPLGAPRDFTQEERSAGYRLEHARRVIEAAQRKSGWVAMLISQHIDFLYADIAKENPDFDRFLREQHEVRKVIRRRYGINQQQATAIYEILRFCDRCSLILCQNEVPSLGRQLEINQSIGEQRFFIRQNEAGSLEVTPWCFADDAFTVSIEVRKLDQLAFEDDEELQQALAEATVELKEWTFAKGSSN